MNESDGVTFGSLTPDGLTNVRVISQADLLACPRVILVAEHYRDDGTCRCDVATTCPTCNGEGVVPALTYDGDKDCRACDGVGITGWR
jgi:hypothetical protein